VLSPLMRRMGSSQLKLDGTIPREGNAYELPLELDFYGRRDPTKSEYDEMARLTQLAAHIDSAFSHFKLKQKTKTKKQERAEARAKALAEAAARAAAGGAAADEPTPVVHTRTIDWKEQQKNLDELFEKQSREQLANLPEIGMPGQLTVKLFDHQVVGIRWLVSRERNTSTPFYETIQEKGKTVYFCSITNSSSPQPPKPVQGSLLCDCMGLVRCFLCQVFPNNTEMPHILKILLSSSVCRAKPSSLLASFCRILLRIEITLSRSSTRRKHPRLRTTIFLALMRMVKRRNP